MRYAWIEEHRDDYAVSRMCGLLKVSRTGYCNGERREPSDRARAKRGWMRRWRRCTW